MFRRRNYLIVGLFLSILLLPAWSNWQVDQPQVSSPKPRDVLQGAVSIMGSTDMIGFQLAEVSFGYDGDTRETWFLIEQSTQPVNAGTLAVWDTTTITDGDYRIRVRVYMEGGEQMEVIVPGLKVRNYTEIQDSDLAPTSMADALAQGTPLAPTQSFAYATPTPLASNPAQVTAGSVFMSFLKGVLFAVIALVVVGAFLFFRMTSRRR